jgi:hypothetical protein
VDFFQAMLEFFINPIVYGVLNKPTYANHFRQLSSSSSRAINTG